jgi:hypothetical protein
MGARENTRLTTGISSPHRLVPASHHQAKSRFSLMRGPLQLRPPINPDQMGLIACVVRRADDMLPFSLKGIEFALFVAARVH